ncbi:undecaprenyl-diphosphate phosphatase [Clostridium bowmanii]|uniref:undecaprenyl-diphosphate phosphatase n=1 Tax=Clostridium bowmanii TaxID=132925 RepID=UPI001C0E7A85|nr:undecaprenyl-diphosphate phosphatase [Clostridium bowmanii]MBU3192188.1 undecaprenyl-diphosphate phosphatase [Clostridium bowmanii]MCA1074974.1 undecaprenyl-diphosphate phosphatase [Clostridium bowmanii]
MDLNIFLVLKAIIIAIVEGITEFIPISSTGHMIIVGNIINFKGAFANSFEVVIQLGAILAIIVLYWNKIWSSVVEFFKAKPSGIKFWTNIIVAFIPAAVLGFLFNDRIDKYLFNPTTVALALVVGGILMIIIENKFRTEDKTKNIEKITIKQAFKIGCFQCFALWPGMSRSASTIMGGWISGVSTVAATEFSFFLAIPTMFGATALTLFKSGMNFSSGEIITLFIGFVIAFLVALIVVEKFVSYLKKKPMKVFAIYRIIVGIALLFLIKFVGISL